MRTLSESIFASQVIVSPSLLAMDILYIKLISQKGERVSAESRCFGISIVAVLLPI